jgi:hypothetical protein
MLFLALMGEGYVILRLRGAGQELAKAGPIQLGKLETEVPPEILLPRCTIPSNAAIYYVAALNSYNRRRTLPKDRSQAYIEEPPIALGELENLLLGSRCTWCDLYESRAKPFRFLPRTGKALAFEVASDPFTGRPYIPAFRMLSEVALREGKRRERNGNSQAAETIYYAVWRMAVHLRQRPGSFMDIQLALEIERHALHYLDVLYRQTGERQKRLLCWKYADSLNGLTKAVQHKYSQLGNFEAAREIALGDHQRVWRIEAIAALKSHTGGLLDVWHTGRANGVFETLRNCPDADVARAARKAFDLSGRDEGPEERHEPLGSKHKEAPAQL